MSYDLDEHRHRFAVWTAARAAQRGFVSVDVLRDALEATEIARFVLEPASLDVTQAVFDSHHREWCLSIVRRLRSRGVKTATFGRAAKLVAVYLKTMIVIGPNAGCRLSLVIHPPIDRYLLRNLAASSVLPSRSSEWRQVRWTQLDERSYYELIAGLREALADGEPFWSLERFWDVSR
jgi:hypothetical protein